MYNPSPTLTAVLLAVLQIFPGILFCCFDILNIHKQLRKTTAQKVIQILHLTTPTQ